VQDDRSELDELGKVYHELGRQIILTHLCLKRNKHVPTKLSIVGFDNLVENAIIATTDTGGTLQKI